MTSRDGPQGAQGVLRPAGPDLPVMTGPGPGPVRFGAARAALGAAGLVCCLAGCVNVPNEVDVDRAVVYPSVNQELIGLDAALRLGAITPAEHRKAVFEGALPRRRARVVPAPGAVAGPPEERRR